MQRKWLKWICEEKKLITILSTLEVGVELWKSMKKSYFDKSRHPAWYCIEKKKRESQLVLELQVDISVMRDGIIE